MKINDDELYCYFAGDALRERPRKRQGRLMPSAEAAKDALVPAEAHGAARSQRTGSVISTDDTTSDCTVAVASARVPYSVAAMR